MRLRENPGAALVLIEQAERYLRERDPRPDGLHLTDLIYCLRKRWYKRQGLSEPPLPFSTRVMFLLGHGHQALLTADRPERHSSLWLGEHEVHGTIDYDLQIGNRQIIPVEIKTTRASSAKLPDQSQPQWIEQLASYCLMLGVEAGQLAIWYMVDWQFRKKEGEPHVKPEEGITLRVYDVEFTGAELSGWREELTRRAALAEGEQLPPLEEHRTWECDLCPYGPKGYTACEGGKGRKGAFFIREELPEWARVSDDAGICVGTELESEDG